MPKMAKTASVQHKEVRWNPYTKEWFCIACGCTSDHIFERDARAELGKNFKCELGGTDFMPSETKEVWFHLSKLAAIEEDPAKLLMLVQEISRLLKNKEISLTRAINSTNV